MDSLDATALKSIFELLQTHFPERLDRLVFVGAPAIFFGLWRVVSPFLDAVTKDKVRFVGGHDGIGEDAVAVPAAVLPKVFGGGAELRSVVDAAKAVGLYAATAAAPPPVHAEAGETEDHEAVEAAARAEMDAVAACPVRAAAAVDEAGAAHIAAAAAE